MLMMLPCRAPPCRRPEFLARQEDAAHEVQVEIRPPILQRDLLEFQRAVSVTFGVVAARRR